MIKLIGDITMREMVKICEDTWNCDNCPLQDFCLLRPHNKKDGEKIFNRETELRDDFMSCKPTYAFLEKSPNNFIIDCNNVYLNQRSIDVEIKIPAQRFENIDNIIINNIKYKKDKGE